MRITEDHIRTLKIAINVGQKIQWLDPYGELFDVKGIGKCSKPHQVGDDFMDTQFAIFKSDGSWESSVDFYDADSEDFFLVVVEPFFGV